MSRRNMTPEPGEFSISQIEYIFYLQFFASDKQNHKHLLAICNLDKSESEDADSSDSSNPLRRRLALARQLQSSSSSSEEDETSRSAVPRPTHAPEVTGHSQSGIYI